MPDSPSIRSLSETLLEVYRAAFELGHHEVAFHALSGAAHAAESLGDDEALATIEQLARDHMAWIDANAPGHRLSPRSAANRGHHSVFEQLATTAAAMRSRIKVNW